MSITKAPSPWLLWVALTTPLLLSILYDCVQDCNHPLTMPRLFILKVRCFHKSVGDLWQSPYWPVWASGGCFWFLCARPSGNCPYDQGQRESNLRIQVAELEFSFNFLSCMSCLGYQHLVYPQAGVELLSKEDFLCLGVVREKPPFKYIQPPTSSVAVFIQKVLKSKRWSFRDCWMRKEWESVLNKDLRQPFHCSSFSACG